MSFLKAHHLKKIKQLNSSSNIYVKPICSLMWSGSVIAWICFLVLKKHTHTKNTLNPPHPSHSSPPIVSSVHETKSSSSKKSIKGDNDGNGSIVGDHGCVGNACYRFVWMSLYHPLQYLLLVFFFFLVRP